MKRRLACLIVSGALLASASGAFAQNLIQNPGCESAGNPPPGWTQVSGNWSCNAFVPVLEGAAHFYAGSVPAGELQQDIDVSGSAAAIDLGTATATFSGAVRSFPQTPADLSRIVIEYRDAGNTVVLDSFDTGNIANVGSWLPINDARTIAAGTRTVRVRLISTVQTGPDNDGYYDDLSLVVAENLPVTAIPTVSQWGLMILTLLLLTAGVLVLLRR